MEGKDGEVRRIHVIYFLSRTGRIEQPHLIRVTHLNKNGLYLRDVKRWLSELRGKDMPDSFSWSYKSKYKKGYVWQDLLDDDLITPISDNEFVLKGSEIVPASLDYSVYEDNKGCSMEASPESNALFGSSVTDDEKILSDSNSDISSSFSTLLKKIDNDDDVRAGTARSPFARSKSYGVRASLFRNLLACGAVDADESVLVTRSKDQQASGGGGGGGEICRGEKLGGSARVFGTYWNQNPRRSSHEYDGTKSQTQTNGQHKKPVSAAYRPVHGPTCSQCGKSFRPEKLHKHMKSCKGLKNVTNNKVPTTKSTNNESAFSYFLTN